MARVIPFLGLRAFAEAGRRGSMKAAAEVMCVTPGAVSQQIKLLEDRFGVELFERRNREIHLTAVGARLHGPVVRALDQLDRVMDELEDESRQKTLTVSTVSSFAASWLVPRLGRFTQDHPDCEIRVEATSSLVDLNRDRVDVAIRHGLGDYPGLRATKFLTPRLVPVASPALLAKGPDIKGPQDCLEYPLLQDNDRADWALWLAAQDVSDPRTSRGPSFEDDFLLIRAALAGQGLALVRDVYAKEEIEAGRLKVALDLPWPAAFAYYVVTRPRDAERPEVASFVSWLLRETTCGEVEGAGRQTPR